MSDNLISDAEAVRLRHSVRQYKPDPIEPSKVSLITDLIREINAESGLGLQFIGDAGKTYNRLFNRMSGLGSAPSVIACVGPDDSSLDRKVGYYGEKLVLFAQKIGLNTCWTGTFNARNLDADIPAGQRLVICIAIGYGTGSGRERRSRTAAQISSAEGSRTAWFDEGVNMALLAPTALNQQKFLIRLNSDESVDFIDKGGAFSQVDLGIVMRHFEIGSGRKQIPD